MSIAAVQKQLAASEGGTVALRAYLQQLCDSLGASMIADKDRLCITVAVDDSVVEADVSVSLGLIVTELVINALKHAFPDQPSGTITIDYHSDGSDWTLSVRDDGIGLPTGRDAPKAGLGTGIVEALAKNLLAEIEVSDAAPGTSVTIRHRADTGRDSDLAPAA